MYNLNSVKINQTDKILMIDSQKNLIVKDWISNIFIESNPIKNVFPLASRYCNVA